MEYIKEVNINEAIIHVLDNNADEPILNEYALDLDEEKYNYLLKHIQKCLKDEELKYGVFNSDRNIVKDLSQEYLNGENNLLAVSKDLARQMFILMRSIGNVPSCDLVIVSFTTEFGPMLGIFKMDYIKNYVHTIEFVDNKLGIDIVSQVTGLPGSSQRIQKCTFLKPIRDENNFDLMVIDKKSKNKEDEEYGSNYFISDFLGCTIIDNERDVTKNFVKAAEKFTQNNFAENADEAEVVRSTIKRKLREEDNIDLKELSEEMFSENNDTKEKFVEFITEQGVSENISLDKEWIDKKLKRVRLKIDKDIDLYVNEETYHDNSRFEIQRNGDGTINMVIKHVSNYVEK
ncbi:nucleoid-associated protein [Clostridium sp. CM028]|uniref:nucleoid-associated protein n=1 Tax=unclassified Clostridium TaxID=2614128 RepID=UPI001C0CFB37|nr:MULTISPECIES: nucleoid-associated protein [unclassified Clostridium]MBU3090786.1 nucleoid-associated protein [Clostridium sp. CF011]MBW9144649.1 nucleoid-associated protein [Clostridium sp. CM027]MBW9147825.1 nucleoid-associated protein [Clostridium sp. CM028]UVE40596.1 nucleoid-associated protein [Clostridium sp. CM027]WAG69562.1 nucleoid-associated protein [Clostridium sp. CF011]